MIQHCTLCGKSFIGGQGAESDIVITMKVPITVRYHLRCWINAGGNIPVELLNTIRKLEEEADEICKG